MTLCGSPTVTRWPAARQRDADPRSRAATSASNGCWPRRRPSLRERRFDEASISEIAAAAEISRPTFYFYFASKQGLLDRLIESTLDELIARHSARGSRRTHDTPADELRGMLHDVADMWVEHGVVLAAAADLAGRRPVAVRPHRGRHGGRGRREGGVRHGRGHHSGGRRPGRPPRDDRGAVLDERAQLLRALPQRPDRGRSTTSSPSGWSGSGRASPGSRSTPAPVRARCPRRSGGAASCSGAKRGRG